MISIAATEGDDMLNNVNGGLLVLLLVIHVMRNGHHDPFGRLLRHTCATGVQKITQLRIDR